MLPHRRRLPRRGDRKAARAKKRAAFAMRCSFQRIDKVDALPSKACKQSFDGCINLL